LEDAPHDILDCFAGEPLLASAVGEVFSQQIIDDFLSEQPNGPFSEIKYAHVQNDDFLQNLMKELENSAPGPHTPGEPDLDLGQAKHEVSQAQLQQAVLAGQDNILDGDAGKSIAIDDFLEFSRSIADDTVDDLLDEAMSTAGDAPASKNNNSAEKPRNGAAHRSRATASTSAAPTAKRGRGRRQGNAGGVRSPGARRVRRQVLPEVLVNMIRSGRVPAARVKAAMAASERARHQRVERAQRVKKSFLAGAEGTTKDAQDAPESPRVQSSKPEVVRRAPVTAAERLWSLYQTLVEARKEWHVRVNLLQMLLQSRKNGKNRGGMLGSDDARLQAQRKGVQQAAEDVLEASGALLLARVELRIGWLPEETVYCCQVEGKFQVMVQIAHRFVGPCALHV
jgi:hypothetical protein